MSEKLTKVVVDCITGNQHVIDLTEEEVGQIEADKAQYELEQQAVIDRDEAKKQARAQLINRLGITEQEADILFN